MTVGQLKKQLEGYPEATPVYINQAEHGTAILAKSAVYSDTLGDESDDDSGLSDGILISPLEGRNVL